MLKKLEGIIRESEDFAKFSEKAERGDLAKTILLISKDGDYAFEFARLLSCLIFGEGEHYQKVLAGSHPDLKVYPTKDRLLVADSEEIVFESAVKPIFAGKKVFIIREIDKAMEQAQNKLLKTLEEPENNVYFILTTSNVDLVLPTIRSRCEKTFLGKLGEDVIGEFVGSGENSDLAIALSEGLIGRAESLVRKSQLKGLFESVLEVVTKLKSSRDMLRYSKAIAGFSGEQNLILTCFAVIMEDLLYLKSGNDKEVRLKSYAERLSKVKDEYSFRAISEIRGLIDKASREIMFNCNFVVVLENLILNILEVKYLCR